MVCERSQRLELAVHRSAFPASRDRIKGSGRYGDDSSNPVRVQVPRLRARPPLPDKCAGAQHDQR
jgi:hypothetical protein